MVTLRVIGWTGIFHVVAIVVWMAIHIAFNILNPVAIREGDSIAEIGIAHYSNFPGYIGLDHGSKALVMLLSVLLPIGLFVHLKKAKNFTLPKNCFNSRLSRFCVVWIVSHASGNSS